MGVQKISLQKMISLLWKNKRWEFPKRYAIPQSRPHPQRPFQIQIRHGRANKQNVFSLNPWASWWWSWRTSQPNFSRAPGPSAPQGGASRQLGCSNLDALLFHPYPIWHLRHQSSAKEADSAPAQSEDFVPGRVQLFPKGAKYFGNSLVHLLAWGGLKTTSDFCKPLCPHKTGSSLLQSGHSLSCFFLLVKLYWHRVDVRCRIISALQQSVSLVRIHTATLFQILFSHRWSQTFSLIQTFPCSYAQAWKASQKQTDALAFNILSDIKGGVFYSDEPMRLSFVACQENPQEISSTKSD